jgi:hypothetical protein
MDAFTYGLKPVPFGIFLLGGGFFGDTEGDRLMGFPPGRPSFSAHVRWGERGAPVQGTRLAVGQRKPLASSERRRTASYQRAGIGMVFNTLPPS